MTYVEKSESEIQMNEWVKQFIAEIDRIENFYLKMQGEYKKEFNTLKDRFLRKQFNLFNSEITDHQNDEQLTQFN